MLARAINACTVKISCKLLISQPTGCLQKSRLTSRLTSFILFWRIKESIGQFVRPSAFDSVGIATWPPRQSSTPVPQFQYVIQLYNIHGEFLEINHATRRGDYNHWWKHPTPWAVICAKASESLSIRRAAVHGNGRGQKIFLPGGNFATLLQYQLASQGQGNDMLPQNCKDGSYRMPMASHLSKWYLKQKKKELYKDIRDPLCCCFFFPLREVIFQTTPSIFTVLKKIVF